jgi:prevent-host-death family protein
MQTMSAKDAKNSFGLLLDRARAEPVQVEKHGRPVVVVVSVEEFKRLSIESKKLVPLAEWQGRRGC